MKIKNLIWVIFLGLGLGLVASCTDLVVDEKDSQVVVNTGSGTSSDPADLLEASYGSFGNTFTDQQGVFSLMEHTTDELIPPTRGVDWSDNGVWRSLYTHTWDGSHAHVLAAWNNLNQAAYRTQLVMEAASATPQQIAEAKFLRAFNRWYIVDFWGQMPERLTSEGAEVNPKVWTRAEAVDLIDQDLTEALVDLPADPPAGANSTASKAAANTMLARLYLNKAVYTAANPAGPYTFDAADMTKVVEYCDAVTGDGYDLSSPYFDNFAAAGSNEIILTSTQGSPQNRVYMTLHYNQNPSGWNGFTTLADFYSKLETGDERRHQPSPIAVGNSFHGIELGFLEGQQVNDDGDNITDSRTGKPLQFTQDVPLSGAATDKGVRVIKYHPGTYGKYILLRYADVFLMKVEALFRGGDVAGALLEINALRALRGATPLASITEQDILDERGRELYWEGIRRTDLIRFGKFNDDWAEKGDNKDDFRVLFVIPQQALDSNPNLVPNPGY